ncbi:lysosomal acid glucosylceramidase-like [Sitodiplosis mosellana]|uniref:lysosomal acid glucosylceramidase-like n=1 Tax=Sitodiplosis mosellana TaxID=263140 RepID=UPI002444D34E|nr:lysosomal acid glucosylceramidase-like [Sitodiplosis mosellana]
MKALLPWLIAVISSASALTTSNPCDRFQTEYGYNCKCTEIYCDTLDVPEPDFGNEYVWITSSQNGERFSYKNGNFSTRNSSESFHEKEIVLWINQRIRYEKSKIVGFGGALTGASSYVVGKFSSNLKLSFYESYFSKKNGIGYNMLRVPIGGSDFDLTQWTYEMEPENDTDLLNFTKLDERDTMRNAQIKEAKQSTGNDDVIILGATWSPPRWMKAKQEWYGKVDNQLLPQFYQTWANYHAKWLNLMKDDGMPVWSISTGMKRSNLWNK